MTIQELLTAATQRHASDLHLSAGLPPLIRVDGDIQHLEGAALSHDEVYDLIQETMNDAQRDTYRQSLEIDYAFEIAGIARFRVNAFHQGRGSAAVFRTIPSRVPSLQELGLGDVFQRLAGLPRGLVLVTGPTGSGKSTTLAAMIDYINETRQEHILTIEDPVEFIHASRQCLVNQRQVHRDTQSFSMALRSALREDPDVILVGELRDLETIRLALTAAETGHLVFATLHTASAAKSLDRLIDVFPGDEKVLVRSMLSESLQGIVSQILLKRREGGRVAAHEILLATPAIRNLIREGKLAQIYSAIQTGAQQGMQTLDLALAKLVCAGEVSREVAESKAVGVLPESHASDSFHGGR